MQSCSLRPTNRYPITDTAQFLDGDTAIGVFGLSNNALADSVVCPSSELPFFAGEFLQTATRGLRAFGLELLAQPTMAIANMLDRLTLVGHTIAVNGDIGDSEIDTEKTPWGDCWCFVNIACHQKVKLPSAINEIGLTTLALQQGA